MKRFLCLSSVKLACQTALIAFSAFGAVLCAAQGAQPSDPNVDNGTHWYGTYDGVHENISLSSGNLSFCIPLVTLKGRAKHDLSITLCYNSQFQEMYTNPQPIGARDVLSYFPWAWATNTPSGDTTPPMGPGWSLTGTPVYYASTFTTTNDIGVEFMPDGAGIHFP